VTEKEGGIGGLTVSEYVQSVAEGCPTPGGGSVSSLIASLSSALLCMVGSLTARRLEAKKARGCFETRGDTCCEEEDPELGFIREVVSRAHRMKEDLLTLAHEDAVAYDRVIAAYRLSKDTEEEKQARSQAIQDAFKGACLVPAKVVKLSLEALRLSEAMAEHGMKSALSDVAVACLAAWAGMRGAYFNVRINLECIKDEPFVRQMQDDVTSCLSQGRDIYERVMARMEQEL
jgi:formiminotetrahydrofolate cyclodeaminase